MSLGMFCKSLLVPYRMANYALKRVAAHAALYQGKISPYDSTRADDALFRLLITRLMRALETGDTLLYLVCDDGLELVYSDDDLPESWQAALSALPSWQQVLLMDALHLDAKLMAAVAEQTTAPALLSDWQVMATVDSAHAATAADELTRRFAQRLSYAGLDAGAMVDVLDFYRDSLRVYYRCHLCGSLPAFIAHLKKRPWLMMAEMLASEKTMYQPLILQRVDEGRYALWLMLSWQDEFMLARHVQRLQAAALPTVLATPKLDTRLNAEQRAAIMRALNSYFSIITGGPGTGKTFTVASLVMALLGMDENLSLALSAPTGKAAQRMQESLQKAMDDTKSSIRLPQAQTLHRLLGMGSDGVARFDEQSPLPYDVIIIDEASMLGVSLARKLLAAVKTGARLILLGDVDQLAAVEAGAVLADLCRVPALESAVSRLVESRRFHADSDIGKLAAWVRNRSEQGISVQDVQAQADASQALLGLLSTSDVLSLSAIDDVNAAQKALVAGYAPYFTACQAAYTKLQNAKNDSEVLDIVQSLNHTLAGYRILCAGHQGQLGTVQMNEVVTQAHQAHLKQLGITQKSTSLWYHGRALMVMRNDYELGLYNGDVGICVAVAGALLVYFDGKSTGMPVAMLDDALVAPSYAISVHKSQGSEFDTVAITFDGDNVRLLNRELIYTAITRAKRAVQVYAPLGFLVQATFTPTVRHTGLKLMFV